MGRADYRPFVKPADDPRVASWAAAKSYREYTDWATSQVPLVEQVFGALKLLVDQPYQGVTNDGRVRPGLVSLRDESAPVDAMVAAAGRLLRLLDPERRSKLCLPLDAREWRCWNNSEMAFFDYGLRLEEQPLHIRDAAMAVVAASLSDDGYITTRHTMWLNEFLGKLLSALPVFNEWSYSFTLFGELSTIEPWGWQLMGHHLSLSCVVLGGQMVLSPIFFGSEPAYLEDGPYAGVAALADRELGGLELVRGLPRELREQVVLYQDMRDPSMPPGRVHVADQLHLGGMFQDNRVIPYEGAAATRFGARDRRRLLDLIGASLNPLAAGPKSARLAEVEEHLDETYFCWIGATEGVEEPFYYRIQSPVILIEFDHHSGVILSNEKPMTFHIHTLVRTPNGNDYGKDLLRQHYERHDHGKDSAHAHGHVQPTGS